MNKYIYIYIYIYIYKSLRTQDVSDSGTWSCRIWDWGERFAVVWAGDMALEHQLII